MKITAGILGGMALVASATPINSNLPNSAPIFTQSNTNVPSQVHNANHVFNALHSSMRQWGSAWYHNGMSFFLASVPAGTQFYHGTRSAYPVNGTEWLAFEPEHALNFARGGPPGGPGKGPRGPHGPPGPPPMMKDMDRKHQNVLDDPMTTNDEEEKYGYMHTYTAAKDLRLLYIDGLSAGKTDMGTLDSADRILLRDNLTNTLNDMTPPEHSNETDGIPDGKKHGPMGEYERAVKGCAIAKNEWNDRIDGFVRAEAGFEIILCDFARDLDLVRISAVSHEETGGPRGFGGGSGYFYRSIASRFDTIGGERVRVNYDNFVTAFSYKELDLFNAGKNEMPRLNHFSSEELDPIRDDLTKLVMEHETTEVSFNWQSIVDMIVTKYSNLLMYFASDEMDTLESLQSNITGVFRVFIDDRQRDASAETERCAMQFIPALALDGTSPLAGKAIYDVSSSICSSLRSILDDTELATAKTRLNNLVDYLSWTTWKECKTKCGYNEACFIPIWPFGTVEDRLNPQCKDGAGGNEGGERYWQGGPGGGRPPPIHGEL